MEQREYWEQHGKAFADLYEQPTWFNRTFRRAMFLRTMQACELVAGTPGATVLDIGCGNGRNSVLFVKQAGAARVVGVDLADDMVRMARQLAKAHGVTDRCSFAQGDFMSAEVAGEFDYSVALGVMEYLPDPVGLMARARARTRRAFLATFPGLEPVRLTLRKLRYALRGCPVHFFSRGQVRRMILAAGFARAEVLPCTRAGWTGIGYVDGPADARTT